MTFGTRLVSVALLAVVCGSASSQYSSTPQRGNLPPQSVPGLGPRMSGQTIPSFDPPPSAREKSVDELLDELEQLKTAKAELEKKEQELKATLSKRLEKQNERLKKLGMTLQQKTGSEPTRAENFPGQYPPTLTKESPKKKNDEIVVLFLPHLAKGTASDFATADRELADKLEKLLTVMAKGNEKKKLLTVMAKGNEKKSTRKMRAISPLQVDKFKMANPQWQQMSAAEIDAKLNADFVLEIILDKMRLYQPGSLGTIYEGRADVLVNIYEVGVAGIKDQYPLPFAYPPRSGVRDASTMPVSKFRAEFLESLATSIARMDYDFSSSANIAPKSNELDRIGRIIIEGNTQTPDENILGKLTMQPGQILCYPALESARTKLEKAGFRGVKVEVIPSRLDSAFKDIRVTVDESRP